MRQSYRNAPTAPRPQPMLDCDTRSPARISPKTPHRHDSAPATPAPSHRRSTRALCRLERLAIAVAAIATAYADVPPPPLLLVSNAQPAATIIVADQPLRIPLNGTNGPLTQQYAAEELQAFIEKATGARLPILPAAQMPAEGTLILVGHSAATAAFDLATPTQPEALRISTFPRGLAIVGEVVPKGAAGATQEVDRATLFGVYEFLERVVGYRFYFADKQDPDLGLVTPSLKDIAAPAGYALELAPDFPHRRAAFASWEDEPGCMRCTREGSSTGFIVNHTDEQWGIYRKAHPEYFALQKDGSRHGAQLCYSEPGVITQRIANVLEFDKSGKWEGGWTRPSALYIPFVPRDAAQAGCQCPACLARLRSAEERGPWGKVSNIIFHHGSEVAREVSRQWPGRRVSMLAYWDYTIAPDFDLPDNLDVMVCQMSSATMNKEEYWHARNMDILREWSAKVGGRRERLYVWNYLCWPAFWTEMPILFPHSLQTWLRDTHSLSSGEFVNPPGASRQLDHFMAWLWHRLMWDRNADVDALLRDYCEKFYGPAAKPMQLLYATAIERYENVKWSRPLSESYIPADLMYLETFPEEPVARMTKHLSQALSMCPRDEANIYRRRVKWMQRGLDPFFKEATHAHRWLKNPPTVAVRTARLVDEAAWAKAMSILLVQGNYGYEADLPTTVATLRDTSNLYVRCTSSQPEPPGNGDKVTLRFRLGSGDPAFTPGQFDPFAVPGMAGPAGSTPASNEWVLTVSPDGKLHGANGKAAVLSSTWAASNWTVTVKIDVGALELQGRTMLPANFERIRRADSRKKQPVREYCWMPKMRPPWNWPMRYGTLTFDRMK